MANQSGWRRGAWSYKDSWLLWHGLGALGTIAIEWQLAGLLGIGGTLLAAFVLGGILTVLLRSWVQLMTPLALPLAVVWYLLSLGQTCSGGTCTPMWASLLG